MTVINQLRGTARRDDLIELEDDLLLPIEPLSSPHGADEHAPPPSVSRSAPGGLFDVSTHDLRAVAIGAVLFAALVRITTWAVRRG